MGRVENKKAKGNNIEVASQTGSQETKVEKVTGKKVLKTIGLLLLKLLIFVGIGVAVFTYVITLHRVSGNNMFPNMKDGDLCVVYRLDDYFMNNVVLYKSGEGLSLGRIVALPGQEVEFPENGGYLINGYDPSEEIAYQTFRDEESDVEYPLVVSEGTFFILNDFRSDMKDSRKIGLVSQNDIVGKVIFILRRRSF